MQSRIDPASSLVAYRTAAIGSATTGQNVVVVIEDDDWRLQGQEKYLLGRTMRWTTWVPYREDWDHDHCECCMAKISDRFNVGDDHVQYKAAWVTADDSYRWVCRECFSDFRSRFAWSVVGDQPTPELPIGRSLVRSSIGQYACVLRRGKNTRVETVDDVWTVAKGEHDGRPILFRVNTAYLGASDLDQFPIRIGVALPLNGPDGDGWPSGPEGQQLQMAEDAILAATRGRAVLVLVITGTGMREFVFHARTDDWIGEFDREASASVRTHQVQVMAQNDPGWTVYRQFVPAP